MQPCSWSLPGQAFTNSRSQLMGRACTLAAEIATPCSTAEEAPGKVATDQQVWGLVGTLDDHNTMVAPPDTCTLLHLQIGLGVTGYQRGRTLGFYGPALAPFLMLSPPRSGTLKHP